MFFFLLFRWSLAGPRHKPTLNRDWVSASYNWNTNNHNSSADVYNYWNYYYCKNNRHNTQSSGNNNRSCFILNWNKKKSVQQLYVLVSLLWTVTCIGLCAILDKLRILWMFISLFFHQSLPPHHPWKQPWQEVPQLFYPPQEVLHSIQPHALLLFHLKETYQVKNCLFVFCYKTMFFNLICSSWFYNVWNI